MAATLAVEQNKPGYSVVSSLTPFFVLAVVAGVVVILL
jgi:hypothetical protein